MWNNSIYRISFYPPYYNRYGEGKPWTQGRVRQFFADEELLISSKFWNLVCKSDRGYEIVLDELRKYIPDSWICDIN